MQAAPIADTAPLNVKKIRRRGLVSGVHLALPPSPLPLTVTSLTATTPRTSSTPGTALTFTAEWDLTQNTFVFTPFESEYPHSAVSPRFLLSPVPVNVDDDSLPRSPAPTTPSFYSTFTPSRASMQVLISPHQKSWSSGFVIVTDDQEEPAAAVADDASSSEPSTPVSPIFDSPSEYSHGRKFSQSTAASSVTDLVLPEAEKSAPPKAEGDAAQIFAKESHRAVPATTDGGDVIQDAYKELDQDLILSPMDVFERTLWEATVPDVQAAKRGTLKQSAVPMRRPLANIPRNAVSRFSMYSLEVSNSILTDICSLQLTNCIF